MTTASSQPRRWYHWFHPDDSPEERRLIVKLDLLIVIYAFVVYWVKYLDQANINNAYVSGLSEDLGFKGNQLVHLQTMYILGAVLGQIPFAFIFPKVRMNWLIPSLDVLWGIFTLLQYRTQTYSELMAYRFMVGLFESAFFPGVHYVFGAWYRGDEIGRRGGVFYVGLTLGTLTAGLLQGAASRNLSGVLGLASWRWMFIINSIITLPVGIIGFFVWPGTPEKAATLFLTKEEVALAEKRLARAGHRRGSSLSWKTVKRVLTSSKLWLLVVWDVFFWNSTLHSSSGAYLLWLKSLKRFSNGELNNLSTTSPALGIFYILFICFGSDLFLGRAGAITIAQLWSLTGLIILIAWNVSEAAKWFAFNTTYASVAMSSVLYGWANDILKHDDDERAFTLIAMNTIAQSSTAWTPLLVYKTIEAPRFLKGYSFTAASAVLLIASSWTVQHLHSRQEKQRTPQARLESASVVQDADDFESHTKTPASVKVAPLGS